MNSETNERKGSAIALTANSWDARGALLVIGAILLNVSCSRTNNEPDGGNNTDVGDTDVDIADMEVTDMKPPSHSECASATSEDQCEATGCTVLSGVEFYAHTPEDGCREVDGFICVAKEGGSDQFGFYWREREDGTHVAWSWVTKVWPWWEDDYWKDCHAEYSPACACTPQWNPVFTPDMGRDVGEASDVADG